MAKLHELLCRAGSAVGDALLVSNTSDLALAPTDAPPHQTGRHRLRALLAHLIDRQTALGLAIATGIGVFDLLDHSLGPVRVPAADLLIVAPLVTAARTDAKRTAAVSVYAVLLALLLAPQHPLAQAETRRSWCLWSWPEVPWR